MRCREEDSRAHGMSWGDTNRCRVGTKDFCLLPRVPPAAVRLATLKPSIGGWGRRRGEGLRWEQCKRGPPHCFRIGPPPVNSVGIINRVIREKYSDWIAMKWNLMMSQWIKREIDVLYVALGDMMYYYQGERFVCSHHMDTHVIRV